MSELKIISACVQDRSVIDVVDKCIDLKKEFSPRGQTVYKAIKAFYERDASSNQIDLDLLTVQLKRDNKRHAERFGEYISHLPTDTSNINIRKEILETKLEKLQHDLGAKFINYVPYESIKEELQELISLSELGLPEEGTNTHEYDVYTIDNFSELGNRAVNEDKISLHPPTLNAHLSGGLWRQSSVVIFGRPDMGKTTFVVNLSCGFLDQGLKVLYLANEDPATQLLIRHLQCLRGLEKTVVEAQMESHLVACKKGLEKLTILETPAGTIGHLDSLVKTIAPDVVIVDQLRNMRSQQENRVLQLEEVQREIRQLGKKYNCVTVSVTQAGGSAENKIVLGMNDIDFSKTGIAGACDLMLGIGASEDMLLLGQRMISLPKNKISGNKEPIPLNFRTDIARVS